MRHATASQTTTVGRVFTATLGLALAAGCGQSAYEARLNKLVANIEAQEMQAAPEETEADVRQREEIQRKARETLQQTLKPQQGAQPAAQPPGYTPAGQAVLAPPDALQ